MKKTIEQSQLQETKNIKITPSVTKISTHFWRVVWMLSAVGFIQWACHNSKEFSIHALLFVAVVISIPIWLYRIEYQLFSRQALLSTGGTEDGNSVKLFYAGNITKAVTLVTSIFFSILLISLGTLFQEAHWYAIYVDVLVIAIILHHSERLIAKEVKEPFQGLFHRKFLYVINAVIITLIIVSLDFWIIGVPDTRSMGMEWQNVFFNEFNDFKDNSKNLLIGLVAGGLAGINALGWHFMQIIIPEINNLPLQLGAWLLFLIPSAVHVTLILWVLLGVLALLEYKEHRGWKFLGDTVASKSFMITLLILASLYAYAHYSLSKIDFNKVVAGSNKAWEWINPCDVEADKINNEKAVSALNDAVERKSQALENEINNKVKVEIDRIFIEAEKGIDEYLNWYFTIIGEYTRLTAAITGDVVKLMHNKLMGYVFDDTGFSNDIETLDSDLTHMTDEKMTTIIKEITENSKKYKQILDESSCSLPDISLTSIGSLKTDGIQTPGSLAGGVVAGRVIAKGIGKKTASAIAAKLVGKNIFKLSASVATKLAVKEGISIGVGSASGAVAGSFLGPVGTVVGGVAGAVIVWVAIDKAVIELDELISRDEMRIEMLQTLNEQRPLLKQQFIKLHAARIKYFKQVIKNSINRDFIPGRDGIRT